MQFRLGKMSVGDILDRSLKLLFGRLGTFYLISLIVQSPLVVFQILAPTPETMDIKFALVAFGSLLLALILSFVGMAAQIKVIEQAYIDRKVGIGEALAFAMTRFLPVLLVSIVLGLVVGLGFILCIIPGIIFFCMYGVSVQAVVLEGVGPFAGMDRSAKLTKKFWGRIFGIIFLNGVLQLVVVGVLGVVLEKFAPSAEVVLDARGFPANVRYNRTNQIIHVLVTTPITILFSTYGTICLTLAYFDLRTRKEGFDLELAARGMPQTRRRRLDDDDDDDDRPRRRRDEDDDDDRPRRRPREDEADEDDRPRRRRVADDDEDDRPRRGRRDDEDDEDDQPRRRRDADDDDDDRPRRR